MGNTNKEEHTSQDQEKNEKEPKNPNQEIGEEKRDAQAQETDKEKRDAHGQNIDDKKLRERNRGKNYNTYCGRAVGRWFLGVLDVLYKLAGIVAVAGIFIAWHSLHTTLYPQDIPGNQNYIDMANAGDVYSQMFLAEHYFEIGEYGDAIYWYKLATINEGAYQAAAYNNLGVIYANGFGLSDYESEGFYRFQRAYQLFRAASNLNLSHGKENAVTVLRMNSVECFPDINEEEIDSFLEENYFSEKGRELSEVESTFYRSFETSKGVTYWEDNTKYTLAGTYAAPAQNNNWTQTYYMYYGQTYKDDAEIIGYEFVYLSELVK